MKSLIKNICSLSLAAILTAGTAGCSDFLDVTDESSVSPDNFPTNMEHVDLLLNSAYAGGHGYGLYAFYWFPQIMYLLDKTHDCYGDYDSRSQLLANDGSTSCTKLREAYASIMNWIQYSNAAIDACDAYAPQAAENEMALLNRRKGEALFLRGLAYWHSQIFFELESKADGLGFPIISKVPESIDQMSPARASVTETWNFTIDTFREAAELLKGNNSDKTRATEWAAKAMLAKSLMQARRPDEARPVLEDIIRNSGASLLDFDTYSKSFFADEAYEFNRETLYEIDMTANPKQDGPWGGFTTGSGMQLVMAPWYCSLDLRWKEPAAGNEFATQNNGGWGNNFVHDGNVLRFGFPLEIPPIRVLNTDYNSRSAMSTDNYPWILDPSYAARSQAVRDNKECDPRLFIAAGQPYFDTFKDPRGRDTWYDRSPEAGDLGYTSHYYFSPRKFTNLQGTELQLNSSNPANIPIVRLADIYLLYAETIAATDAATALEYVNKVHRRAYGYAPDAASPVDYASLSAQTMAARNNPQDLLANNPLRYERWAELFAEGQWWYDIRRWEILENEMKVYKKTRYGNLTYIGERGYAQPIPKSEIEAYNGNLPQNYNY
ncbi:MAG: RagB/SusD family nutrient uptake outer membrane protein [Bacteroides sp.]|nr:RagB/SusD family nutrient uptake outer membrane protein [Bacteroides sp.]